VEELANSVTHGVGVGLALIAVVALVVRASLHGDAWRVATLSVFGATLLLLYSTSTLYHALHGPRIKRLLFVLDHSSILLLIAGSYTPVMLVPMRGPWGWTIFFLIWALALFGIVAKMFLVGRWTRLWVGLYVTMGWLALIALKPMLAMLPSGLIVWIFAGGACYTLGVVFFALPRMPFNHAVWHVFVMAGSFAHVYGMLLYLTVGQDNLARLVLFGDAP